MGSATSKNLIDVTTNVITKSATKIMNKLTQQTINTQSMIVENVDGDVDISKIDFNQVVKVNLQGVFNTLLSSDYQDELRDEIQQEAKSLVAGLNIGQYADAVNKINTVTGVIKEIIQNVASTCANSVQLNQVIAVKNVRGNLSIKDISLQQLQISVQNCVSEAISKVSATSSVQDVFKQKSSSEAQGVDIWAIAVIIFLLTVGPGIFVVYGAKKIIFPIMVIIGIALLISHNFFLIKTDVEIIGYSNGIMNSCTRDSSAIIPTEPDIRTLEEMRKKCINDENCIGFDLMSYKIDPNTRKYEQLINPIRNFYNKFAGYSDCLNILKKTQDNSIVEPYDPSKPQPNVSGIKTSMRNIYLLISGILTIIVGAIGIFVFKN